MAVETDTRGPRPGAARVARLFASPASVLVIVPALVVAVGVVVLLLGRRATRDSAETMARHQLMAQAIEVQNDIAFALGQAEPVFASLRVLAEPALATPDAVARMRDVVLGRPGIANATIVFPIGVMWGTYIDRTSDEINVHETRVGDGARTNYRIREGRAEVVSKQSSSYEPRDRPQYLRAVEAKTRVWLPPRTFESSGKTGLTVTEPVYDADGTLTAVLILDFDVGELSKVIRRPPIVGARTLVFTIDGTVLAYPTAAIPDTARQEKRLLHYRDFKEPALDALFGTLGATGSSDQRFVRLDTPDGAYLAAVTEVSAERARGGAALEWYLATMVPESTLLGASRRFGRETIIASGAALAIALGVALMFAWNVVRMRRAVAGARAEARSAAERAKQLGSYRLVERLGAGGMGEVWRAEHQLLARHSAIKLVRAEALRDPDHAPKILERFRREAQTVASLRSRHTIEVYDYGVTEDGAFFLVMELLDGVDLSELVRKHGPQPAARVIHILAQACQSLAEAHDAGLLHRDIKPANLFLCKAADEVDILKLLDFGIVHDLAAPLEDAPEIQASAVAAAAAVSTGERLTAHGSVIGTPGFIPPEQATGARLDARGDLYALGCVAWYLLVGTDVYLGKDEDEVLKRHVSDPIPALRDQVRGWLPPELERLITACLAKHPSDRPRNARELAEALFAIEIPKEHAWTRTQAKAWWASLRPSLTSLPETPTAVEGVVVTAAGKPRTASAAPATTSAGMLLVPQRAGTDRPGTERPATEGAGGERDGGTPTVQVRLSNRDGR